MSTKALRQLLEDATNDHPMTPRLTAEGIRAARAELDAIETAARDFRLTGDEASPASWVLMDAIGDETLEIESVTP